MDVLCLDFLNSEFHDFRGRWVRDELLQPDWVDHFLVRWNLHIAAPLDETAHAALLALRSLLRSMIEALEEGALPDELLALFNTLLLKTPMHLHLKQDGERYHVEMAPLHKDWQWVQTEIAASFAYLLTEHDPRRIKLCANPFCRGAFYDDSKSRTKRYCTADKCANFCKVRRFRARHKAEA